MGIKRCCKVAAVSAFLLMTAAGCGKKAPPFLPPRQREDFLAAFDVVPQRGGALIAWLEPPELPKPPEGQKWSGYRITRRVQGGDAVEVRTVDRSGPGGVRYQYLDLAAAEGAEYRVELTGEGRRAVYVSVFKPRLPARLLPPRDLAAASGDGGIRLSWSAGAADGAATAAYYVFRRQGNTRFSWTVPITPQPIAETFYDDQGLENGQEYCYAVSMAELGQEPAEESAPTEPVCASPRDATPPAAPAGLDLRAGPGYILLTWRENSESDLLGYVVYRRDDDGAFRSRTPQPLRGLQYRDTEVEPGVAYAYAVTALDAAIPPNESPYSEILTFTISP